MTEQPPTSIIAAFFSTLWGRILAVLTAIALLLGIAAEGVSLITGYYNLRSAKAESQAKSFNIRDLDDASSFCRFSPAAQVKYKTVFEKAVGHPINCN